MILQLLKKIFLLAQTPLGYRLDYWRSFKRDVFTQTKPMQWMNYNVINSLENYLKPGALVFEYGSGSSTRYWISKGCKVISVEHDKNFFLQMQSMLTGNCNYLLFEPELDPSINKNSHESPDSFKSADFEGHNFEAYVKAIDIYPDDYFDLVVVDGRARASCIKRAVSKIKRGGVLLLDNSDRECYLKNTQSLLDGWTQKIYRGTVRGLLHKEQTTIFYKP